MRSISTRAFLDPSTPWALKGAVYLQYKAAVATYELVCGPYDPPSAPPEPPADKIHDVYSK